MSDTHLLILGKGEIARCLAALAQAANHPVTVCEPDLQARDWPAGARLVEQVYTAAPWPLPPHTHAVIVRGHEGDAESVAALLQHGAEHVYLIASARRSQAVMRTTQALLSDPMALERLSAPAGLALGGGESGEIALSILAEIQWRRHGGPLLPLRELRAAKALKPPSVTRADECPGQRP